MCLNYPGKHRYLICSVAPEDTRLNLREGGYAATGVELNPDYLKLANELSEGEHNPPNFIQGDVRRVDFGVGYDAVVIMFNSFGYFNDEEDKLVLAKIFDALKERAKF